MYVHLWLCMLFASTFVGSRYVITITQLVSSGWEILTHFPQVRDAIISVCRLRKHPHLPAHPFLSTILGATVTYQCDHLTAIRAVEDSFDICTIGVRKPEFEYVEVVLRVFRDAQTCAFWESSSQPSHNYQTSF